MTRDGFTVQQVDHRAGAAIVELEGEIDMANVDEAAERLLAARGDEQSLVIDLAKLRYLDSAGIRMFFDLSEQLAADGARLSLAAAGDAPVRRVLAITKIDTLVPVHEDVGAAVHAVSERTP